MMVGDVVAFAAWRVSEHLHKRKLARRAFWRKVFRAWTRPTTL